MHSRERDALPEACGTEERGTTLGAAGGRRRSGTAEAGRNRQGSETRAKGERAQKDADEDELRRPRCGRLGSEEGRKAPAGGNGGGRDEGLRASGASGWLCRGRRGGAGGPGKLGGIRSTPDAQAYGKHPLASPGVGQLPSLQRSAGGRGDGEKTVRGRHGRWAQSAAVPLRDGGRRGG